MSDTVVPTETATNQPLAAPSSPAPSAPTQDNAAAAEVDRLRKEAEQAKMRANQLENQLKAKADAEEAARLKALEEQEQYKSLYEQTQAKLREVEQSAEQKELQAKIKDKEAQIVTQFPEAVLKVAQTAGLSLTGTDEDAVKSFTDKLTSIQTEIGAKAKVTPNNNAPQTPSTEDRAALIEHARTTGDKTSIDKAIGTLGFVKAWNNGQQ